MVIYLKQMLNGWVLELLDVFFYSPKHTVSSKRITVSCTITWTAAIFMEAPVSHHAPVTVGSTYSRFTDAVPVGGVAE